MSCAFCCRTKASSKQLGVTFHSFPKDNHTRNAWVEACVSRGCVLDENINSIKLCSVHFTSNDYEANKQVRTFLKKRVVPSRFSRKPYMHCIVCSDVGSANSDVYLHEFPEDSVLRKKWIDACRQNGFNIQCVSSQHRLCSKHFPPNCFTANDVQRKYLELDAVPLIFPSPTSSACSVQRGVNLITNTKFVESISSVYYVNATSCSVVSCNDMSTNSSTTSKCIDDTSSVVTKSIKRRLPFLDSSVSRSPPESSKKNEIWRPARAGDLRQEHFGTPRRAKTNLHILSAKCKEYKRKIAQYRSNTCRFQKKIRNLENVLSHITDKKLISEEAGADISVRDRTHSSPCPNRSQISFEFKKDFEVSQKLLQSNPFCAHMDVEVDKATTESVQKTKDTGTTRNNIADHFLKVEEEAHCIIKEEMDIKTELPEDFEFVNVLAIKTEMEEADLPNDDTKNIEDKNWNFGINNYM